MNKYSNVFFALWMRYNPEFWSELRDIERKLLFRLIVSGESIEKLAKEFGVEQAKLRVIFESILMRVERNLGSDIAGAIRHGFDLNRASKRIDIASFEINRIYLN